MTSSPSSTEPELQGAPGSCNTPSPPLGASHDPLTGTVPIVGKTMQSPPPLPSEDRSPVTSISFAPTGDLIVSGLDNGAICLWDLQLGKWLRTARGARQGSIDSLAFSPDSTCIASAARDLTILLWGLSLDIPLVGPFVGHTEPINSIAFSPNGIQLVSGSSDHTIYIWDVQSGSIILGPLEGHTGAVLSLAFSPDGARIVSGSGDCTVCGWNVDDGDLILGPLQGHDNKVLSVAFLPQGDQIMSCSSDCTTYTWDAQSGAVVQGPIGRRDTTARSLVFSSDATRILSSSDAGALDVWDARTGLWTLGPPDRSQPSVWPVAISPDGTLIAAGSKNGVICLWDASTGSPMLVLKLFDTQFELPPTRVSLPGYDHIPPPPNAQSNVNTVSREMSNGQLFQKLLEHGCTDMTLLIDPGQYTSRPISTGGFGDIWGGKLLDGTPVAVKALRILPQSQRDTKSHKRITREIYNWSKLKHNNVQELMGVVMLEECPAMVSAWQNYGDLQGFVRKNPNVDRYDLYFQVTTGVSYIHSKNMVHGDIKAANILVSRDNVIKISDFDHSILADSTLAFSDTTNKQGGTLRWMAPELVADDDSCRSKQTDVYSLGMTMLEIATGEIPYPQYSDTRVTRAKLNKESPSRPLDHLKDNHRDNQIWNLLIKCWDDEPSARPTAFEALDLIKHIVTF